MTSVLVIKTGALGDVLRTTAILPGLARRFDALEVTWVTAEAARPLVDRHRLVDRVVTCSPRSSESVRAAESEFAVVQWDWVLSLDDELPLCELATRARTKRLSGAYVSDHGTRVYTDDVEPWFGMGLLSRDGKHIADRRKVENTRTHPAIFAEMLEIEEGRPELPLPPESVAAAKVLAQREGLVRDDLVVGLNTGSGGRWTNKGLPLERVVAFAGALTTSLGRNITFLVLGGEPEADRNRAIVQGINGLGLGARAVDGGTRNNLPTFAAIVGLVDLLLTSDSLAMHMGLALEVPTVAFFAPTSAAEIELYGLGEKVASTGPDYCSYRPDASNESITVERLVAAARRTLAARSGKRRIIDRPA